MPKESTVRQVVIMSGIVLFVSGVLGAKLIALVMLAGASASVAVAWCSAEMVTLFVLRYFAEGQIWRHHMPGLSGVVPSLVVHVAVYLSMLAAPFPLLRCANARPLLSHSPKVPAHALNSNSQAPRLVRLLAVCREHRLQPGDQPRHGIHGPLFG